MQGNVLANGMTPIAMVIVCNGSCSLFALIIALVQRKSLKVSKREMLFLVLLGVIGLFITDFLLNVAYTLIPVGFVTMIHFTFPSIVCIVLATFFHEGITWKKIAAIVLSLAGLALFAGGGFTGSLLGVGVAAITALSYAFYMIANDKTPARNVDPMVRVFYSNLFVAAAAVIVATKVECVFPTATFDWVQCFIVGLSLCMGFWFLTLGIDKVGAFSASFINMVEPISSMVTSALFFHYAIGIGSLVGCALILASMFFTIERKGEGSEPALVEGDVESPLGETEQRLRKT